MKNIRLYNLEEAYHEDKVNHEYPTVSYCKETDTVYIVEQATFSFEFVDLGLPSGLKWATCNVGATKPEEFGLYFAWGETQGYTGITDEKQFKWADYKWSSDADGTTMTKYNADDRLLTLEATDDAATVVDSGCRIPTKEECEELTANTTSVWTEVNGVYGYQFTSSNSNSIFVPAAGAGTSGSLGGVGYGGGFWSSSLDAEKPQSAFGFNFSSEAVIGGYRYYGLSIRPVKK